MIDVESWYLMGSVYPVTIILAVYLSFVLKFGPMWMRSRKPFNLQSVIIAYNAFQVVFNTWIFASFISVDVSSYLTKGWCEELSSTSYTALAARFPYLIWWYLFCKVIELLDTVFFVLRMKQNQVTFLHVYYHSSQVLCVWAYLKYHPGEQGMVIILLNSFVHVVMYSYYLLASLGPQYQKYLWWKKYMTWIQLTQFCLIIGYLAALLTYRCPLSKSLSYLFLFNTVLLFSLLIRFYKSAYKVKNKNCSSVVQMEEKSIGNIYTLNGYEGLGESEHRNHKED